jgi:hypothetical protein
LGVNIDAFAVRDFQAVTIRPAEGVIVLEFELPLAKKLTGACVISTLSTAGAPDGPDRRACQRIAWTVSRKLSAWLIDKSVTGKNADQNSLPAAE